MRFSLAARGPLRVKWQASTNTQVGYMLPVFDAGYAVVASSGGLPATPIVDWLHSAPVDVLIASLTFGWVCGKRSVFFSVLQFAGELPSMPLHT